MIISISTDDAAAQEDAAGELARILRKLAQELAAGNFEPRTIRDINGNTIGSFRP